jgi:hypothetical protein
LRGGPDPSGRRDRLATTLVVVQVEADDCTGLGYTYSDASPVTLITEVLAKAVADAEALDTSAAWRQMQRQVRNLGRDGLAATDGRTLRFDLARRNHRTGRPD